MVEKRKTFCMCCLLCCFKTDPLIVIATIPVGGFVSGQLIPLHLHVINNSDQSVHKFQVQLMKVKNKLKVNILIIIS